MCIFFCKVPVRNGEQNGIEYLQDVIYNSTTLVTNITFICLNCMVNFVLFSCFFPVIFIVTIHEKKLCINV